MIHTLLCGSEKILVGQKALIMGILNVTPDSFSDGGNFMDVEKAIEHVDYLVACGADIIDIGGESSRPFSNPVNLKEEIDRVIPVIELISKRISIPISIDTTKSEVAKRALDAGASIVNDISSMRLDTEMIKVVSRYGSGVVLMHMRGKPSNMQLNLSYDNLLKEILSFLFSAIERAIKAGIRRSSIIIDPGLGFAKSTEHNYKILKNLRELKKLELPILIGPSRKAFIRNILELNLEEVNYSKSIEMGTQAIIASGVMSGANIVRVHNVFDTRNTLKIMNAIQYS